ncbi:MAG TPA: phosphotransferase [Polyangiales bacterium]|nr:phosphotransferase [Polyangiales bacterium]
MSKAVPLTPEQLAARSERACSAAIAAGRELGLSVSDATVLHDSFSVVVHLAPAPVVARVPVVLPDGFELTALKSRQVRELSAVAWLAQQGQPVVRPSPLVPRTPVQHDGFSMTFWEHVEVNPAAQPDYDARALLVAQLHATLREYPAPLPFLAPLALSIPSGLARLAQEPGWIAAEDLERAQREWAMLAPVLASRGAFSARFPGRTVQALHGDSPAYNLIDARAGLLHGDFEDATLGPLEWDLTLLPPSAVDAYDATAMKLGLRKVDHDVLAVMTAARMLQVVSCLALIPQMPALAQDLAPSLELWRKLPFAGGIEGAR